MNPNMLLKLVLGLTLMLFATATTAKAQDFYLCKDCGRYHPVTQMPKYASSATGKQVNRDQAAFSHALREAQILARRGFSHHPLGVAPGARYSGTGSSFSPNDPNHCYDYLPESRLVARAMVPGPNGLYWWSAHYR
jgi:hypothetical protein